MASYAKRVHVKYSASQMFDLVADIDRYPQFVPWIVAAHIRRREGDRIFVDMTIGTNLLRKNFSTVAALDAPHRIDVTSTDPLVERFEQHWAFAPDPQGGSIVDYRIDFKFRSRLLQMVVGGALGERASAMVEAFQVRARRLYGMRSGAHTGRTSELPSVCRLE